MAIYHCNVSNVSRGKGSSSCATLSYITGQKVKDERLDTTFDYGRKERVLMTGTLLPEHAPREYEKASVLFNSIEKYEKSENARTGKKIEVALPREFDINRQREVVEKFIRENITSKGYACAYAIHTDKENSNPHAHILVANRQIDEKGQWAKVKTTSEFVRDKHGGKVPIIDEKTGEQKVDSRNRKKWKRQNVSANPLDKKETLENLRERWAVECNKHLAQEQQIDHRSLAEQGKEQMAAIHEGYSARQIEQRGGVSERCEYNREISKINEEYRAATMELADTRAFIKLLKNTEPQKERTGLLERFKGMYESIRERQAEKQAEKQRALEKAREERRRAEKLANELRTARPLQEWQYQERADQLAYLERLWREKPQDPVLQEALVQKVADVTGMKINEYDAKMDIYLKRTMSEIPDTEVFGAISRAKDRVWEDKAYAEERESVRQRYRDLIEKNKDKIAEINKQREKTKVKEKGGRER